MIARNSFSPKTLCQPSFRLLLAISLVLFLAGVGVIALLSLLLPPDAPVWVEALAAASVLVLKVQEFVFSFMKEGICGPADGIETLEVLARTTAQSRATVVILSALPLRKTPH